MTRNIDVAGETSHATNVSNVIILFIHSIIVYRLSHLFSGHGEPVPPVPTGISGVIGHQAFTQNKRFLRSPADH
ncbi:hypothetical protein QTP86_008839 [Hemibagrus guttatus]|nr:hypothetical protein QTP86_008839 [Hemibagrus guttatus]